MCAESNLNFLWFCIHAMLLAYNKTRALFQPFRSETNANRDSFAHVFPRFSSAACFPLHFPLRVFVSRNCVCSFVISESDDFSCQLNDTKLKSASCTQNQA